jgi:hypothetical protein
VTFKVLYFATEGIHIFRMILTINTDCFADRCYLIGLYSGHGLCFFCEVRIEYLYVIYMNASF